MREVRGPADLWAPIGLAGGRGLGDLRTSDRVNPYLYGGCAPMGPVTAETEGRNPTQGPWSLAPPQPFHDDGGMDENRAFPEPDRDLDIEPAPAEAIVVGHDGSKGADAALEVALQLGADLQAPVTILRAWSMMTAPRPADWTFGYVPSIDEFAEAVGAELTSDTLRLVARFPQVTVTCRAHNAGPARAMIEASREARMLVVGSRGLGGFRELVLGSVSDQCVRYAHCPVLVARN